jgi:hypothetical protein
MTPPDPGPPPTTRLYWQDDHCFEAEAIVVAVREHALAFDRTCFIFRTENKGRINKRLYVRLEGSDGRPLEQER